jgi:tRNA(adenine34) deaminase
LRPGTSPPPVRIPIRRVPVMAPGIVPPRDCGHGLRHGDGTTGRDGSAGGALYDRSMNYELFMGEALAEARNAIAQGERPNAAVAVVDEAMVARAHDRVRETDDPTAHAVVVALREAARKLGRTGLANATIFTTLEPCPMCVGALLESNVETLVFALPNLIDGAAGTVMQLAQHPDLKRRIRVISGIRRDEAEDLRAESPSIA